MSNAIMELVQEQFNSYEKKLREAIDEIIIKTSQNSDYIASKEHRDDLTYASGLQRLMEASRAMLKNGYVGTNK